MARALLKTLSVKSPVWGLPKVVDEKALTSVSELKISSWDDYLIELAKEFGINKIRIIDEGISRES